MKKIFTRDRVMFILGVLTTGAVVGAGLLCKDYVEKNVPYFVRSNGLKYTIHYLQGKDAWDEIYTEKLHLGSKQ